MMRKTRKVCTSCKRDDRATWECRVCRGRVCKHFCSAKAGPLAHCGSCSNKTEAQQLAIAFCLQLRDWIPMELAYVVSLNADEPDPNVCHTHDFCDANEAMGRAWERVRGVPTRCDSDSDAALWGRAWDLAIYYDFDPGLVARGRPDAWKQRAQRRRG